MLQSYDKSAGNARRRWQGSVLCYLVWIFFCPSDGFTLFATQQRPQSSAKSAPPSSFLESHPNHISYQGLPSSPGWRAGQLDKLTDWAVSDEANRPVICEYQPDALWLWTRWRGTVLSLTFVPVLLSMVAGLGVDVAVHTWSASDWNWFAPPPPNDPILLQLEGLNTLWGYQVTLCTFILTFFTAEACKHWRSVYFTTRAIQGRINDVCMLATMSCQPNNKQASDLVATITRLIKKSHTFFWAVTPTSSNGVGGGGVGEDDENVLPPEEWRDDAIGPLLLSPVGLEGLVKAGELTRVEANGLLNSGLPPSQYAYILLEWVGQYIMEGLNKGWLGSSSDSKLQRSGLEENIIQQLTRVRAEYFSIGDFTAGRMPLAYVQLVQVLVDSLIILAPFSLYCELGSLTPVATGLLTLFFKGLLELSKSFLDPFGNEGFPGQNIRVDVLVSELNYGASSRWIKAAEAFPMAPSTSSAELASIASTDEQGGT